MDNTWLDHDLINRHSLDRRQFMDFRSSTLPNGMRVIDAYNSSGLSFTILPDRGLDIWSAHYNGMPLTWIAPGSPHPSDYGRSWLDLFNGGLLTTCGLTHVGPAEDDRDLHGDYTRQLAEPPSVQVTRATHILRLKARVHQSRLFGEQLQLLRTYTMMLGRPQIHIHDRVTNRGDEPVPFMMLYHCNIGYPFVHEGAELVTSTDVYPRDEVAQAGAETWQYYEAPSDGYAEQVFFHHSFTMPGEQHDLATLALVDDQKGLEFSWNTRQMPYLTQWKNTRRGIYVCGIEPGNCIPEGQNAARDAGRLVMLEPGATQHFDLFIRILDGQDAVQEARFALKRLRTNGVATEGFRLADYKKYMQPTTSTPKAKGQI